MSQKKKIELLRRDVQILAENKIPLDIKGNQPNSLMFQIDNIEHLNELLDAMVKIIHSKETSKSDQISLQII